MEEKTLIDTLDSLSNVDYDASECEVIIVAGGENTLKVAKKYAETSQINIRVISQDSTEGKNKAILDGLKVCKGGIIVLLDADSSVHPGWLRELVTPLKEGKADFIQGYSLPMRETWISKFYTIEKSIMKNSSRRTLNGSDSIAFFKKIVKDKESVFFNPDVKVGFDYYLSKILIREGYTIWFNDKAVLRTYRPDSLSSFIKTESRWAKGLVDMRLFKNVSSSIRDYFSILIISSFLILLFAPGFMRLIGAIILILFSLRSLLLFYSTLKENFSLNDLLYFPNYFSLIIIIEVLIGREIIMQLIGFRKIDPNFKGPRK